MPFNTSPYHPFSHTNTLNVFFLYHPPPPPHTHTNTRTLSLSLQTRHYKLDGYDWKTRKHQSTAVREDRTKLKVCGHIVSRIEEEEEGKEKEREKEGEGERGVERGVEGGIERESERGRERGRW